MSSIGVFEKPDCALNDGDILLGIRPEAAKVFQNGPYCGKIEEIIPRSADRRVILRRRETALELLVPYHVPLSLGEMLHFALDESGVFCLSCEDNREKETYL